MAISFLDVCRFNPTAGGTGNWTYSSAVQGYQSPSAAGVVNGATYRYRAESGDLTQWEIGYGTYNTSTGVLSRSTILFNSSGTTSAINFSTTPQVAIVVLAEDLAGFNVAANNGSDFANVATTLNNLGGVSYAASQTLTAAQAKEAQANILVAPTIQKFLSGSGTYTTPTGCTRIRVRMVGGGGGGGGGQSNGAGSSGGNGGNTTFGTSLLVANGGTGGSNTAGVGGNVGGTASLGTGPIGIALQGGTGGGSTNNTGYTGYAWGGDGAASPFGGAGGKAPANTSAPSAIANTGSGGGGSSTAATNTTNAGAGGGAGGYIDAIINSPSATYSYAVGAGGTAGAAGANGFAGGAGGSGVIIVEEYYGS